MRFIYDEICASTGSPRITQVYRGSICCMFPCRRLDALRFRSVTRLPPTTNSQPSSLVTRLKTFKEVAQHLHRAYALKQHLDIGAAGANRDKTASSESETHVRLPFFEKCKRSLHSSHSGMYDIYIYSPTVFVHFCPYSPN